MYIKHLAAASLIALLAACGGNTNTNTENKNPEAEKTTTETNKPAETSSYDPKRGEGKFDANNVKVDKFDTALASKGKAISDSKCTSCHKMTDEKLVGPGWKGVTTRHEPHWIMNFITNPDAMIDKDPKLQAQLELCMVRMPNQNLTDDDARNILEYMRQNDGAK